AIADIVAADPTLDADGLATAGLLRRAERDPSGALRDIASLPSFAQRVASGEIARVAAASDAEAAIEAVRAIDDVTLKVPYLEALHTELSLGDLARWFAFLDTLNPDAELVERGARMFAFANP